MTEDTAMPHINRRRVRGRWGVAAALVLFACLSGHGANSLGPRADDPAPANDDPPLAPTPDLAPLRLAIPVLDPNVPSSHEAQRRQRVWPELRNAESVRIAVKLMEKIVERGTFRDVVVSPDARASADFYLLARIEQSNGEDLKLGWRLADATQRSWIPDNCRNCWRNESRRLWNGWHDAHDAAEIDPFDPLYARIADQIHGKIAELASRHARQMEKNRRLEARGRSGKLSDLETAAATRSLVFAAFFAPDLYGDAVKEKRGKLKLSYLPVQNDDDWARIESIRARDERFAVLVSDEYAGLADRMRKPYSDWQKESFPLAREARLARRAAFWSGVAGGVAAVGAAAAAGDESNPKSEETAAVLATAATVAVVNSVLETRKANAMHAQINEIGATTQAALKPMVVETRDRTITLTGTASEQFRQWRALLRELYANTATDIEAVRFGEGGEG